MIALKITLILSFLSIISRLAPSKNHEGEVKIETSLIDAQKVLTGTRLFGYSDFEGGLK